MEKKAFAISTNSLITTFLGVFLINNSDRSRQKIWVRINPLDHEFALFDLAAVMPGVPDGIVLPKVYSAIEVNRLADFLSALEAREGLVIGSTKILSGSSSARPRPISSYTSNKSVYSLSPRRCSTSWKLTSLKNRKITS